MKIGSLVFATDQGLGILAKMFWDHGTFNHVLVVRHGKHPTHDDWYPGAEQITNLRSVEQQQRIMAFCKDMDVMLFFETCFLDDLYSVCRTMGTKTVLIPMYECTPSRMSSIPDMFVCPSALDYTVFKHFNDLSPVHRVLELPVPVCTGPLCPCTHRITWKPRTVARTFVHNAG